VNSRRMAPLVLVLLLSLLALPAATGAQQAPPQTAASPQAVSASISPLFSYQGRLVEGGVPVTGNRAMTFSLWSASTAGESVWNEGPKTVPVSDGLFTVTLGDTTGLPMSRFASELWLEVQVGATTLPRQQLMGAPYAMSLAPAARVSGDVMQGISAGGLIKLAIAVHCGNTGSTIDRYFTVGAVAPTITNGATAGNCTINPGFDPAQRYWTITPTGGADLQFVNCDIVSGKFQCFLANADDIGMNSTIQILVY
jgi:hypothetical protein